MIFSIILINLNLISYKFASFSSLTCPRVCQWPFCGVQIKDGDTLQWHYEAHYAQELERLDKVIRL